ncbi:hypothetical protein FNH48_20370 [Salmonella enterica subsp. salamae]|nr:hypothetical protein [Salmonella enterica subsp. salamae]
MVTIKNITDTNNTCKKNISEEDASKITTAFMRKHIANQSYNYNYRVTGADLLPGGVSISANNRPTVSEGKIALPESLKSSDLAMPTFGKATEILSVRLKNKIIKDLNLDNWMGLGGEVTPLVMIDFYKKQSIDLIIHAHIKKEAIKTDSIKNSSINLINVGNHYMVLTVNKRGSIELIDVPGDGDCLFHAAVKGQQIAKAPTVNYGYQQTGNHNDEHVILKESIKNHFQNNFDTFIDDIKMILTTEKSKVANNISHDINTYIKLIYL